MRAFFDCSDLLSDVVQDGTALGLVKSDKGHTLQVCVGVCKREGERIRAKDILKSLRRTFLID